MRVAHLTVGHGHLDGRIFLRECRTLAAAGHEVHLLAPGRAPGPRDGIVFHSLRENAGPGRLRRVWGKLSNAYREAIAIGADGYHIHDPVLIPVGLLLRRKGARVIYDAHEDSPREGILLSRGARWLGLARSIAWRILEGVARKELDGFVCATPHIAAAFPPDRTVTVRNFPEADQRQMVDLRSYSERPAVAVYAGAITEARGIREMVTAIGLLPEAYGARLLLLGRFDSPALEESVRSMPGWARVEHPGWVEPSELAQRLSGVRLGLVVLHPERCFLDALPTKLFEYMAAGLPVIASDFPGWKPLVEEMGAGLVVDPRDSAAIALAMQRVLDAPTLGLEMGRRGLAAVRERYHWESEGRTLLDLYRRLGG